MSDIVKSFKVADSLSAQRVVTLTTATANTVRAPSVQTGNPFIGITIDDEQNTNGAIAVKLSGIAKLVFNDTVTCGAIVGADTSGKGIPFVSSTGTSWYIGTLIDADVAATSVVARVLINPGCVEKI
jgi:hypothetical protein